jgi:N-acetylmuramoyl-L-alanine amidase
MSDWTAADVFMLALCLWREARGEGRTGMIAVGCVVRNRVIRDGQSYYAETVRRLQFSSLTAKGDPELTLWPVENDPSWQTAQALAQSIISEDVQDITGGATLYYATSIPFPATWNRSKVKQTVQIGNQIFFIELDNPAQPQRLTT